MILQDSATAIGTPPLAVSRCPHNSSFRRTPRHLPPSHFTASPTAQSSLGTRNIRVLGRSVLPRRIRNYAASAASSEDTNHRFPTAMACRARSCTALDGSSPMKSHGKYPEESRALPQTLAPHPYDAAFIQVQVEPQRRTHTRSSDVQVELAARSAHQPTQIRSPSAPRRLTAPYGRGPAPLPSSRRSLCCASARRSIEQRRQPLQELQQLFRRLGRRIQVQSAVFSARHCDTLQ
jgi:hypothetical protein